MLCHAQGPDHERLVRQQQAFFPGAPMVDMLPAPALGLLTSALAVPSMVLGSLLETNTLPDLGIPAAAPSTAGEYVQSSALTAGEHVFPVGFICMTQNTSATNCHYTNPLPMASDSLPVRGTPNLWGAGTSSS